MKNRLFLFAALTLGFFSSLSLSAQCENWVGKPIQTDAENAHYIYRQAIKGNDYAENAFENWNISTHMLFLAADLEPPADYLPKLLALDHPLVGGHVPTYGLHGPTEPGYPPTWGVQRHMATAAFVMLARPLFRVVRWRWDLDAGMSDDPCLEHAARTLLDVPTLVRHDCEGRHWPQSIGAVETRGHDKTVARPDGGPTAPDPVWVDSRA